MRKKRLLCALLALTLLCSLAVSPSIAEEDEVVFAQLPEAEDLAESGDGDGEVFCEPVDEPESLGEVDLTSDDGSVSLDFPPVAPEEPYGLAAEAAPYDPETDPEQLMLREHVAYPSGGLSNDEAVSGYIDRQMRAKPQLRLRKSASAAIAGSKLPADSRERRLYDALSPRLQAVAKGEESCTIFTIPIKDIYDEVALTAADLGVESLLVSEDLLSLEAIFAFWDAVNVNVKKVLDALLADLPYDLYWFDKTHGVWYAYAPYEYDNGTLRIRDYDTGEISYKFCVASEYSATGELDTFETDRQRCQSIQTAAARAKSIVEQYKALDDIEKLYAYKDAICDMVSYNHGVDDDVDYGDPWQVVWVFDDDDSTNVVCEGYSKAFQYLCDLSAFQGDVSVISAIGYFYSDTGGGGRHMWNNVTIGGATYLADLTNCDTGTIGAPEDLFLKGYSYKEETSYGITTYYFFCGDNRTAEYIYDDSHVELFGKDALDYSDNVTGPDGTAVASGTFGASDALSWTLDKSGTLYIRKADPDGSGDIPDYSETAVAPWCETDKNRTLVKKVVLGAGITRLGDRAFYNCSNLRQISFNAEVSSFGDDVFTGCHMYAEKSRGIIIRYCKNTAAIEYAEDLLASQISLYSLQHADIEMNYAVPATCTETGLTLGYRCKACNKVLVQQTIVPAKGHKPVDDPAVAPTCTESGLTAGVHCSVCQAVLTRQQVVEPTGHTPVPIDAVVPTTSSTGLTEGSRCATCGVVLVEQKIVPALEPPKADPEPDPVTPQADPEPDPVTPKTDPEPDPVTPKTDPEPVTPQADPEPDPVTPKTDPEPDPVTPQTDPGSDPVTPQTNPEPDPVTPKTDPEPEPITPKTDPEPDPVTPKTDPEPDPVTPKTDPEPDPVTPQTNPEPDPVTPQTNPEPEPVTPQTDPEPDPVTPKTDPEPDPIAPKTDSEPDPVTPKTDPEPDPVTPKTDPEPDPVTPQTDPEPDPVAPKTDPEPDPVTPKTDPEPEPVTPQTDPEPEPVAPQTDPEPDPVTPQTDPEPEPITPQTDPEPVVVQVAKNTSKRVEKGAVIQVDTGDRKVVRFSSSNSRVASVTKDGTIITKKAGIAKIVITLKNNKKLTLKIRVDDPLIPKSVKLAQGKKARMKVGEKLALGTVLTPDTAQSKLKWKSSNKKIATVSKKGVVKAKRPGKVKITVTTKNKKKAAITIRVVK